MDRGIVPGHQYVYSVFIKDQYGTWIKTVKEDFNTVKLRYDGSPVKAYRSIKFGDSKSLVKYKFEPDVSPSLNFSDYSNAVDTEIANTDFEIKSRFFQDKLYRLEFSGSSFTWKGELDEKSIRQTKDQRDLLADIISKQYGPPSEEKELNLTELPANEITFSHVWRPAQTGTDKEIKIGIEKIHEEEIEFSVKMIISHPELSKEKEKAEEKEQEKEKEKESSDF